MIGLAKTIGYSDVSGATQVRYLGSFSSRA